MEPQTASRARFGVRLLLVRLRFAALLVVVAVAIASWDRVAARVDRWRHPAHAGPDPTLVAPDEWYCPMDPQVVRAAPDKCPICGMALSKRPRTDPALATLPPGVLARLRLAPRRIALAGVTTVEVARRPVVRQVDAVGTLEQDERRVARVAARVKGRVEELFVDFTGRRVEKGAPLLLLWSPELEAASRELALVRPQGGASLAAARQRLERFGLTPEQVARIVEQGEPAASFEVPSPIGGTVVTKSVVAGDYVEEGTPLLTVTDLSTLWMVARLDEEDAPLVRTGEQVSIRSPSYPERTFEGHVAFVEPTVDRATRTLGVRVDVPNGHGLLRPGMSVRATLSVPLGPDGTVAKPETELVYRCCSACPEIESRAPGACPKCGMPLMPIERPAGEAFGWECRCPMHPDRVWQAAGPGTCGLCGRALTPAQAPAPAGDRVTLYVCPGHPEATRDTPGICLPCGDMELVPHEVSRAEAQAALAKARPEASTPLPGADEVTLYVCPGHPEATRDTPGICVPCGTMELIPKKVTRAEAAAALAKAKARASTALPGAPVTSGAASSPQGTRVDQDPLVVPVDAVVDTGDRRLVFVESSPGTFDAVEVITGPRAGEVVPIVSGVSAGQRVVARGAFLLDAEVRLAPGAASTYFGASKQ